MTDNVFETVTETMVELRTLSHFGMAQLAMDFAGANLEEFAKFANSKTEYKPGTDFDRERIAGFLKLTHDYFDEMREAYMRSHGISSIEVDVREDGQVAVDIR